jgi:lysophospholipase L1-like esterase
MKRYISLFLVVILCLAFTGCGNNADNNADNLTIASGPHGKDEIMKVNGSGITVGEFRYYLYEQAIKKMYSGATAVLDDDVLSRKPDLLIIMTGMNNVWRHFDIGTHFPEDVEKLDIEHFEDDVRKMIEKTLATGCKLILATIFFLEPNKNDPLRKMCDEYNAVVKKLADEYGTYFCDVQAAFDKFMEKESAYLLAFDRIHPNATGHYIIANELLKVIETVEL